jgi:hypothetical protein
MSKPAEFQETTLSLSAFSYRNHCLNPQTRGSLWSKRLGVFPGLQFHPNPGKVDVGTAPIKQAPIITTSFIKTTTNEYAAKMK